MNIDGLTRMTTDRDAIGAIMLRKGLDQQAGQMAQLLQSMPQAPQPAHLGQNFSQLA